MRTLEKINIKELVKLPFKGIEIIECKEGGGGTDFKGIELRDAVTKTTVRFELGPYSDMVAFTEKQPNMVSSFVLTGELCGAKIEKSFKTRAEAAQFQLEGIENVSIAEIQVEET
jgi:hypothetical protein